MRHGSRSIVLSSAHIILAILLLLAESIQAGFKRAEDRYTLINQIGSGVFGTVYRVRDTTNEEMLAMKIFSPDDDSIAMAKREAGIMLSAILCPGGRGVVELRDEFFCFGERYCLVMELMSCDLLKLAKANSEMSWDERLVMVRKIAQDILPALAYMAEIGLVHADIKPENILYSKSANTYKLTDFGLAIRKDEQVKGVHGSVPYISPEVFAYTKYSSASDMWAFAVTLLNIFAHAAAFSPYAGHSKKKSDVQRRIAFRWEKWLGPIPPQLALDLSKNFGINIPPSSAASDTTENKMSEQEISRGILSKRLMADKSPEFANFEDFIRKCLDFNPDQRLTPVQALQHPFVSLAPGDAASKSTYNYIIPKSPFE